MKHFKLLIIAAFIIIGGIAMFGCTNNAYHIDYCGKKECYTHAKDTYRAGQKVKLNYKIWGTDTDYSWYLDGKRLNHEFSYKKGFTITFVMPAHDVKLECRAVNSMTAMPYPDADGNNDWIDGATAIHLNYDHYSGNQFLLDVWVENINADGAVATVTKRVGPMNYTGKTKEGEIRLSREKVDALISILKQYDLKAFSQYERKSSSTMPNRSLCVFLGDNEKVDIPWYIKFPEGLPPQDDVMYTELYNFFNDIISAEAGWEEVRSDNLEDPRDNPMYGEREAEFFGKKVRLIPGTGNTYNKDGVGAEIDYGDKKWWLEEGFTGTWKIAKDDENSDPLSDTSDASFTVDEAGNATLITDGTVWRGTLPDKRYYRSEITVDLASDDDRHLFTIDYQFSYEDSYDKLHIYVYPGPVPERQFAPISVILIKQP